MPTIFFSLLGGFWLGLGCGVYAHRRWQQFTTAPTSNPHELHWPPQ